MSGGGGIGLGMGGPAATKKPSRSSIARERQAAYGDEDSFRVGIRDAQEYASYPAESSTTRLDPTVNPLSTSARLSDVASRAATVEELSSHTDAVGKVLRLTEVREKAALENYRVAGTKVVGWKESSNDKKAILNDKLILSGFVNKLDDVCSNISMSRCSAEDLLELKMAVFNVKCAYDQVDLARRFVLLKKMIAEFHEKEKEEGGVVFNGRTVMDVLELCDHILEAQGSCEPPSPQAGDFLEVPKALTCCAPLLLLYRCLPKSIRQILLDSGWSTIVTLNEDGLGDADAAINSMGIICALLMTVPFGILGGAGAGFWDELRAAVYTCAYQHGVGENMIDPVTGDPTANNPNGWRDPATGKIFPTTDYGWTYQGIRREFLAYVSLCIFSSLNCVILATTYYVFHRGGEKDPKKLHGWWKKKGYVIVVTCGILTILSVAALFALTKNVYVYYSINLGAIAPTLDDWWGRPSNTSQIITKSNRINYVDPGVIPPDSPIFISDVCGVNSLEFAAPAVFSVIFTLFFGLYLVF